MDALARNIYIEEERNFDYSKRKATDRKQNNEVFLHGALGIEEESGLEVMRKELTAGYR